MKRNDIDKIIVLSPGPYEIRHNTKSNHEKWYRTRKCPPQRIGGYGKLSHTTDIGIGGGDQTGM